MDYPEVKELVHIRFELRRLAGSGGAGDARPLIERMEQLALADRREQEQAEVGRWRSVFGLL